MEPTSNNLYDGGGNPRRKAGEEYPACYATECEQNRGKGAGTGSVQTLMDMSNDRTSAACEVHIDEVRGVPVTSKSKPGSSCLGVRFSPSLEAGGLTEPSKPGW